MDTCCMVIEFAEKIESDAEIRTISNEIKRLSKEVLTKVSPEAKQLILKIDFLQQQEKTKTMELMSRACQR